MSAHLSPDLLGSILADLRRRSRPVKGWRLAAQFRLGRLRTVGEAIEELRRRGHRIVSGADGYRLVRRFREIEPYLALRARAHRREGMTIAAMRRGRPPQTTAPAVRQRRQERASSEATR